MTRAITTADPVSGGASLVAPKGKVVATELAMWLPPALRGGSGSRLFHPEAGSGLTTDPNRASGATAATLRDAASASRRHASRHSRDAVQRPPRPRHRPGG